MQATMLTSVMMSRRALRSTHARMKKAIGAVAVETTIVSSTPSSAAAKTSGSDTIDTCSRGSTSDESAKAFIAAERSFMGMHSSFLAVVHPGYTIFDTTSPSSSTRHDVTDATISVSASPFANSEGAKSCRSRSGAEMLVPLMATSPYEGSDQYDVNAVLSHFPAWLVSVKSATIAFSAFEAFCSTSSSRGRSPSSPILFWPSALPARSSRARRVEALSDFGHVAVELRWPLAFATAHAARSSSMSGVPSRVRTCAMIWMGFWS
mmetsp:Transcript_2150/g.6103  ORF Transcript_2150/g.6103 Transcript_2150/m.6103 type:complete len:264 (+) Transcript_2150:299-1090(+)